MTNGSRSPDAAGASAGARDLRVCVAQGAPDAAARLVRALHATADLLADSPDLGTFVPEWGAPYRQLFPGRYRMLYRYDPSRDQTRVLAVIHGSRRLTTAWRTE